MKVYVLTEEVDYEGSTVAAVFSTTAQQRFVGAAGGGNSY